MVHRILPPGDCQNTCIIFDGLCAKIRILGMHLQVSVYRCTTCHRQKISVLSDPAMVTHCQRYIVATKWQWLCGKVYTQMMAFAGVVRTISASPRIEDRCAEFGCQVHVVSRWMARLVHVNPEAGVCLHQQ